MSTMMMTSTFLQRQRVAEIIFAIFLLLLLTPHDFQYGAVAASWIISSSSSPPRTLTPRRRISKILHSSSDDHQLETPRNTGQVRKMTNNLSSFSSSSSSSSSSSLLAPKCRREMLQNSLLSMSTACSLAFLTIPEPAHALVKGNAPPPKTKPPGGSTDKPKCTNVEECQALAEQKEQLERQEAAAKDVPAQTTRGGTRYKDFELGTGSLVVKDGDEVTLHFKVLKLGKRAYDGLSGEGTVVFSRGYGLEDDEVQPGDRSFVTTVGAPYNIIALNEALLGMKTGGTRRFSIFPSQGWRKPGRDCDGGPGGSGAGGDLKTDYVVVPTATMVVAEACFDTTKLPFPNNSYGEQRRMAQRFDQSLIMEVHVVSIVAGGGFF
jgi:FKBP-type peptidyl-prolyl cis-trans isomerase